MPGPRVSSRVAELPASRIREVMHRAWDRPDVIHLEVGEPDAATPPHAVEAAARAAAEGRTRYAPSAGLPELREALAAKIRQRNGYHVTPEQVVVTTGAMGALYSIFATLLDAGDEILVPDPGWPNFAIAAELLGARAVRYPLVAEEGFQPRVEDVERLLGDRSRVLLLNSPSNPLGAVVARRRVQALLALAERRGLWVVSDECYDEIAFGVAPVSPAVLDASRVVSAYSFSKTYAMTGWRVGYAVAPEPVARTLGKLQEPLVASVNTFAQVGALAALTGPQEAVRAQVAEYARRRDAALELLGAAGVPALAPDGAFYLWIEVSGAGRSSDAFARVLLDERGVAVVPGDAFGPAGAGFVRASLATAAEPLLEGLGRLAEEVTLGVGAAR